MNPLRVSLDLTTHAANTQNKTYPVCNLKMNESINLVVEKSQGKKKNGVTDQKIQTNILKGLPRNKWLHK